MGTKNNTHPGHPPTSRSVSFQFGSPVDLERETDLLMEKELANPNTPVTQYGTDGLMLWVNGRPGPEMRNVLWRLTQLGWSLYESTP